MAPRALAVPVRLLLANPYFLPFWGGIEGRMLGLARRLAQRHEVAVLTARLPGTAEEERMHGFTVLRCPAWVWKGFPYNPPPLLARGVRAALAAWDPDVADYQYRWAPEWNRALGAWARRRPAVCTWHNPYGEGRGLAGLLSALNDRAFLRGLGAYRRVICISKAVERDLAARGVPAARLSTVHAGFDAPASNGHGHGPGAGPRREGDHAVFVGRLVATKGLDVLLDALPRVPGARVVLVGKGPELARLQRRAAQRGVADRVRFAGFLPEAEKQALVASAKYVVHPARWEGLGHALAEAMLLGTPVVASDVGGIPEVVGPGGVLVPPDDPRALAEAMRALEGDAGLREALGHKALAHAAQFTWERCVEGTERAYHAALSA